MVDARPIPSTLVVGFGSIGRRHTRILKELELTDVRVCDPAPETLERAKSEFAIERVYDSLDAALADKPDTVFICSPTALHVEQAIQAVEAGADLFIEKPLSVSLDRIDELKSLADEHERIVMVGHCFRFHVGLMDAWLMVDGGRIGRVISIRATVGEYIPDVMPNYRNMYISKYSGVYELMHDIDLALWFAGQRPVKVIGVDGTLGDTYMQSPDFAEMIIQFEDRCVASVHLDFFERARHRQIEIMGTEGTVFVEFASWDKCTLSWHTAAENAWRVREMATDRDDMFRAEDGLFLVSAMDRCHDVLVDIEEGRRVIEVMLAAQESARTGVAVRIP